MCVCICFVTHLADPPRCRDRQKGVYHVARHETTRINCEVEADPGDVRFRWQFNSSLETLDIVSFNQSGPRSSSAYYTPRRKADYGSLICFASNSVGKTATPCVFSILPAGKYTILSFEINAYMPKNL